jgi:hypothetical protein
MIRHRLYFPGLNIKGETRRRLSYPFALLSVDEDTDETGDKATIVYLASVVLL